MGNYLRVLLEGYPMSTDMTGFRFSKIFAFTSCALPMAMLLDWSSLSIAIGIETKTKTVEMREDPTNLPSSLDNCITISSRCTWHRFEAGSLLPFPVDTIAATRHWNIPRSVYKTIWRDNIDYSVISLCAVSELCIGQHQSTDDHPDWLVHILWVWCIFSTTDGASHSHPFGWRLTGDFYDGPSVKEQIKKTMLFSRPFFA